MRPVSAVFSGFVAIVKKSLFLVGSIGTIALSVKGKGANPIPILMLILTSKTLKNAG